MRDLYEALNEAALNRIIQEAESETARLEFKDFGWFGSKPSRDDQKYRLIARPLCAMANTHGGVLVYGIKTGSKNAERVDRAESLNPCASAEKFVSLVSDFATSVIEPPLLGSEARLIPLSSGGYAAKVWVPESRFKPHLVGCSEARAHGHWQRSATGSFRMPQVSIESAYRTRLMQELNRSPLVTPKAKGGSEDVVCKHNQLLIDVSNKGNAPAVGITLSLESRSTTMAEPHRLTCRSLNALAPAESAAFKTNFEPDQMRTYKEFFEAGTHHAMVLRFRDLAGTDYEVTLGLKERRNANQGKMEMSFTEFMEIKRDGRRLT